MIRPPHPSDAARARHPAGRAGRPDLERVAHRLCAGLRNLQVRHPEVAAAALVARGVEGRSVEAFGLAHGLLPDEVEALEAGQVPVGSVPAALRLLTPFGTLHERLLGAVPSASPPPVAPGEGDVDVAAGPSSGGHQQGGTGHGGDHRGARPGPR